ncbi:MAG: carboxylate--amine ligase [Clostridia bacterium]|nr:carboxylate--amine ligase [Clostridia bacterium]
MKKEVEFEVVIVGSDINAYYMARNFHEEYGVKSHWIGKVKMPATNLSSIGTAEYVEDLWDKEVFKNTLINYAKQREGKKLILIGTNDFYVRNIIENKDELEKYYLFNCISEELFNNLALKDVFYTKYETYDIDFPNTYIFNCGTEKELDENKLKSLMFPIIVKPGHNVNYYKHGFPGQAKVYKLNTKEEVVETVDKIKNAGYTDNLIIQEYIPGDDSMLFDAVIYCNKDSKAQFITFAQIGLQEHTPTGIGNCTVLVNGYNQFGNTKNIVNRLKKFAEKIGYKGPGEFDLKYDERDKKFKVLEINPRQGRSSYYPTACGFNIAKYLVDDLIYNKNKKFKYIDTEVALSFVPMHVIKKYVKNKELKNKVLTLKRQKKLINPLVYKKDMNFARKKWLFKRDVNYCRKYKKYSW